MKGFLFVLLFVCVAFADDYSCSNAQPYSGEVTGSIDLSIGETAVFDFDGTEVTAVGGWIRFDGDNNFYKMIASGGSSDKRKIIYGKEACPEEGTTVVSSPLFSSIGNNAEVTFFLEPMLNNFIFIGTEVDSSGQASGSVTFETTALPPDPHSQCDTPQEITLPHEDEDTFDRIVASTARCHDTPTQGHWFHFKGTGKYVLASTCYDDNTIETLIDVYNSCGDEASCIDTDSSSCPLGGSVLFFAENDMDYYILVGNNGAGVGKFRLSVKEQDVTCTNFQCEDAKRIEQIPFKEETSTRLCPDSDATCLEKKMHGIWYQFDAPETGRYLINTCNSSALDSSDTILELHSGCGAAPEGQCIEHSDDFCGRRSAIITELERDHTYQVLVTGYNSHSVGVDYTLSIEKIPDDRKNDECLYAKEIADFPASMTGNTGDMTTSTTSFSCIGNEPRPRHGAWFRYRSTGDYIMNFSTCSQGNRVKADIEVYRSCQNICLGVGTYSSESGCATVTVPTTHDQIISVFVSPTDGAADDVFNLTVTNYPATQYYTCPKALEIKSTDLPFRHKDSTYGGEESWSSCSRSFSSSVWFHFKGTGKTMVATTCGDATAVNTAIELYDACPEDGSTEHCIAHNENYEACVLSSLIQFDSVEGKDYYILAHGKSNEKGIIEVRLYEASVPVNSKCDGAISISLGNQSNGVIEFAAISGGDCSSGVDRRGGWFKFQGTGTFLTADTCNDGTNFNAEVEIYRSCDTASGKGSKCYARSTTGSCYAGSSISFTTEKDKTYYAYVSAPAYGSSVANSYFLLQLREMSHHSSSSQKGGGGIGAAGTILIILVCLLGAALVAFVIFYFVQRFKGQAPGSSSYQSADDVDAVPVASNTSAQERIPDDADLDSPSEGKGVAPSATL